MVFCELSEGHRQAVTEKLKSDIDFAKAKIKPPDETVEFFELLRNGEIGPQRRSGAQAAEKSAK
jgi:hypothetical protein